MFDEAPEFGSRWHYFPKWGTLRAVGVEAATWLNGIVTCDVSTLRPGEGVWGLLLSKQGKICAELQIVGHSEEVYIGISGGNIDEVLAILDGYLIMEDAEITKVERSWLLELGNAHDGGLASEVNGTLPWLRPSPPLRAICTNVSELESISSKLNSPRFDDAQFSRWLTWVGIPKWGRDYSSADNPHAASIERRAVNWSKGCYLGQEVVCMQDMRGKVRKRLVHLHCTEALGANPGDNVLDAQGQSVGEITSVAGSRLLACIRAPAYQSDSTLFIEEHSVAVHSIT